MAASAAAPEAAREAAQRVIASLRAAGGVTVGLAAVGPSRALKMPRS